MVLNNDFGIVGQHWNQDLVDDGYSRSIIVDTKKAKYQGNKWISLSGKQRRKLETLIMLSTTERVHVAFI
jgi:ribosomal protein L9